MPVETERRRFNGFETTRPVTTHVASAVAGGSRVPDGLDWQSFSAAYFPGRRRHDLEGLTAYADYRRSSAVDAQSSEPQRIAAERGQAGSAAVEDGEGEGGATF